MPGVARRGVELVEAGALGEPPRKRVLARARADDEDVHRASLRSAFDGDTWTMAAPPHSTARVEVVRIPAGTGERRGRRRGAARDPDRRRPVAVTMRTPGHDEELALGFALSEGLTPAGARLPDDLAANTVELDAPGFDPARLARSFYTSCSCGVCGKGALEAVAVEAPRVESELRVPASLVSGLPDRLREAQAAFEATGGIHATGLFDDGGELLCVREDVGRHNAMDKVIGWAFLAGYCR